MPIGHAEQTTRQAGADALIAEPCHDGRVTNEWDRYADTWDQDVAAQGYAAAAFDSLRVVLDAFGLSVDDASVIDFGCGTGILTGLLAPHARVIHAVDTSPAMLDVVGAKIERQNWSNVRASTELPPPDAEHDLIVCSSVCSFLEDYPGTVVELILRLRPGGFFVQWDWERDEKGSDSHGLTRAEINEALAAAGLEEISVDTGFAITPRGEAMSPLMGSGRRPGPTSS